MKRRTKSLVPLLLSAVIASGVSAIPVSAAGNNAPASAQQSVMEEKDTAAMTAKLMADIQNAVPGTVVVIPDGLYRDFDVQLTMEGTSQKPIVIRAETPGGVQFTGNVSVSLSGEYFEFRDFYFNKANPESDPYVVTLSGASHARVTGNYFYQSGQLNPNSNVIRIQNNSQHNRVDHNVLQDNKCMGIAIRVNGTNLENLYNEIDHNYLKDIAPVGELYPGEDNGLESIQIGQGFGFEEQKVYANVHENLFDNVTGDGSEIVSNKTSNNEYRNNTFINSKSGFTLRFGSDAIVDGNFFVDMNYGIRVTDKNQIVTNNYFFNVDQGIRLYTGRLNTNAEPLRQLEYRPVVNALITGNTIVNPRKSGILVGDAYNANPAPGFTYYEPKDSTIANNLIIAKDVPAIQNVKSINMTYLNNVASLEGSATAGVDSGLTIADPGMEYDSDSKIYRPTQSAPIVDKGHPFDVPEVNKDIKGIARTGLPDVGAEELAAQTKPHMLTPYDVGPENKWWMAYAFQDQMPQEISKQMADSKSAVVLDKEKHDGTEEAAINIQPGSLDGRQYVAFDLKSDAKELPKWYETEISFIEEDSQEEWSLYLPSLMEGSNKLIVPLEGLRKTSHVAGDGVADLGQVSQIRIKLHTAGTFEVKDFTAGNFL